MEMMFLKCPVCNAEMQLGGLVANGQWVLWYAETDYKKHAFKRFFIKNHKKLGHPRWDGSTGIDNAFYCENCDKIIGIFDISGS